MYHKTLAIRHLDISTLMQCPVDKLLAVTFHPLKRRMLSAKFQARNQALLRPASSLIPRFEGLTQRPKHLLSTRFGSLRSALAHSETKKLKCAGDLFFQRRRRTLFGW